MGVRSEACGVSPGSSPTLDQFENTEPADNFCKIQKLESIKTNTYKNLLSKSSIDSLQGNIIQPCHIKICVKTNCWYNYYYRKIPELKILMFEFSLDFDSWRRF